MVLRTFISQSIKDIFDGIIDAQEYVKSKNAFVNVYELDCMRNIDYDNAVKTEKKKGGTANMVGAIQIASGKI